MHPVSYAALRLELASFCRVPDVPQQLNGHDCGVFTLMFAEYSARGAAFNFQQKHMQSFRAKIVADVCHHHRITNGWPAE